MTKLFKFIGLFLFATILLSYAIFFINMGYQTYNSVTLYTGNVIAIICLILIGVSAFILACINYRKSFKLWK